MKGETGLTALVVSLTLIFLTWMKIDPDQFTGSLQTFFASYFPVFQEYTQLYSLFQVTVF